MAETPKPVANPHNVLLDEHPDAELIRADVPGPSIKVVGRIDLAADGATNCLQADKGLLDTVLQANGVLKSIGNIYGYISRYDTGEDLFFYTNQLRYRPGDEPLQPGMPLVYTLGQNKKGAVAYTIHHPCTIKDAVGLIEALDPSTQYMDVNNFASQMTIATGDADAVNTLLEGCHLKGRPKGRVGYALPGNGGALHIKDIDIDKVLSAIASEEEVEPRILQEAEKKALRQQSPEDYQTTANALLEYAIRHNETPHFSGLIYTLFTRIIKNLAPEQALDYIDLAANYYERRGETGPTAYFRSLKNRMEEAIV